MDLLSSINLLPKTSPITIHRLKSIEIYTFWDLLNYFPYRYENFSIISPINRAQPGEILTVRGKITNTQFNITKNGLKIQTFSLTDQTGTITLNFYNQLYLLSLLKKGLTISVAGEIKIFNHKKIIEPKAYEIITDNPTVHTGRIVPVYPEKNRLSSKTIREKIFFLLNEVGNDPNQTRIEESLPQKIISFNKLTDQLTAYQNIHFPVTLNHAQKAKKRLAFDELFSIQLSKSLLKQSWTKRRVKYPLILDKNSKKIIDQFIHKLPFKLTDDQLMACQEIFKDMIKTNPMNRFLQGDVGSGKTVVAAIACLLTYLNGYQSLVMAPTEILANQHYQTIKNLFEKYPIKIGLQTASNKIENWELKIENYDIIIGTHALLNKKLKFKKVALVIVDEQHRFGVSQREILKDKAINPHLLTMTATPIPRTVALTLYGDLDVTYINQLPKGRKPIKTFFVPKEKRQAGYAWIKKEIKDKKIQVFVICPLIEESDKETMKSVRAAEKEYLYLKNQIFNQFKVGLLHGRLKSSEKNRIMTAFKQGNFDLLVATSVVEVGIDISNATIMLIEGAERYGLAQLHQLRGRVGRGGLESYCLLFTEKEDLNISKRLKFFAYSSSGIQLAEYDLKNRGPGEIFGTKQHGFIDLKIAKMTDYDLIKQTKNAVNYFISHYSINSFPKLKNNLNRFSTKQVANN